MRKPDKAQGMLESWNIGPDNSWYLEVRNKLASKQFDAIYTNRGNGREDALLHIGSYKNEDKNPEALRLFPSER